MKRIAIIGLGYVGLPLAIEFARKYPVLGFDTDPHRITELKAGKDSTQEVDTDSLRQVMEGDGSTTGLRLSNDERDLASCSIFIVTVPTPVDKNNNPDLSYLLDASVRVGRSIAPGGLVIYESTTYPGCTEEDCIPVIEQVSGLTYNKDFYAGYSPERINPGDKVNTLTKIKKVTSGSTPEIAEEVDRLYSSIITAGTHKAPSIKVAEASKIIENTQRDVNISFVNELALIFDRMGIDTHDVLEAAATKWNFLKYYPGLVGGHCISVDPYYISSKAESLGYHTQVILSGRQVNNSIAPFIVNKVLKLMIEKGHKIKGARVLVLGITFKENCPDTRNSKVIDIYNELNDFGITVDVCDPWADSAEMKLKYGIDLMTDPDPSTSYQAIIHAVAHEQFKSIDFEQYHAAGCVIFDVKATIDRRWVDSRL